jgi:hypothetical protein
MQQLTDPTECRQITDKYPNYFTFEVEEYLANPLNFAYKEGRNIGFGEYKRPNNYWVHFCCDEARGRSAIELCKRMVKQLLKDTNNANLVGLVNVVNRPTRWLIRQVGFKSVGFVETLDGECEIFSLAGSDAGLIEGK